MKLYDAFCMFNELDIIEIRLNELYDVVDYFIIHESTKSHTGKSKRLYFAENMERFEKFKDKIIYRCINDTPDNYAFLNPREAKSEWQRMVFDKINRQDFWDKNHLPYSRDAYEKESIIYSMYNLDEDDIVMFSDADEIPNANTVEYIKDHFDIHSIYNLTQKHFWFYLNCMREDVWIGNTLLSFKNFKENSVINLRKWRRGAMIPDGGWHFSFMGNPEIVKQKIQNYGEQSINTNNVTDNMGDFIKDCIKNNHDFYMNPCKFNIVPLTYGTHPQYLINNQDKYKELIF
jgi:beta-1,4-mannosyl-glycoprotein beta-1,4-N-acetylglucosaminyltransferase